MKDNKSAFDSEKYDEKIVQTLPYYEEFYNQVLELVSCVYDKPINWLDVGCGTGKMGAKVFGTMKPKRFVFTDPSEAMVDIAKERFADTGAEFAVCDVLDLPYETEFDVVTAIQVFHFLHEDERKIAVRHCYNALKDGGIFVSFENFAPFTEMGTKLYIDRWKQFQIRHGKTCEEAEAHVGRYGKEYFPINLEEQIKVMRESGFKTVEILWLSNMQVGIWGMK